MSRSCSISIPLENVGKPEVSRGFLEAIEMEDFKLLAIFQDINNFFDDKIAD